MIDIRMIDIDDNNVINVTSAKMHIPLTPREAAIQYVVLALLNTPGTMIDAPAFGGGALTLTTKLRKKFSETKDDVAEVIHKANLSISKINPRFKDFTITNISLIGVERSASRGYSADIRVTYLNAASEKITIPGDINVNI